MITNKSCLIKSRIRSRIRIHVREIYNEDLDPYQIDMDLQHCLQIKDFNFLQLAWKHKVDAQVRGFFQL